MSFSRKTTSRSVNTDPAAGDAKRALIHSIAILCLLAAVCLGLLLFVALPTSSLVWAAVQNVGHFFLFAALSVAYIFQIEKILSWNILPKAILTLAVLTFVGGLAEMAQTYLPERDASGEDLWRNFAGTASGLICYGCYRYHSNIKTFALLLYMLLLVSIFLIVCRPAIELVGYTMLKSAPPVVFAFDDPFIESVISTTGGAKTTLDTSKPRVTTHRHRTLRMDFAQQPYSGVILHEPEIPWHESGNLTLRLINDSNQARSLELRIHDAEHNNRYDDRFNTNFYVNPGENKVLIPIDRIHAIGDNSNKRFLDMQNISVMQLFSSTRQAFTLYLIDIAVTQK